jgi:pimeloyl-ACP methyl ester carboxylesterase
LTPAQTFPTVSPRTSPSASHSLAATTSPTGSPSPATPESPHASPSPTTLPSGRPSFQTTDAAYHQTLDWHVCEFASQAGSCTMAYVPTDYEQPDAGTTAIAVALFKAAGVSQGDLFVNPGGPGVGGIAIAASLATSPLGQTFDIIGFDPRGTGNSDPLVCLGTSALDRLMTFDPTPDTPAQRQEGIDLVTAQGDACATNSGLLAAHVTTIETARDMDVLRALQGDEKLNYLGFSYGTVLGATYAALFPDRVGRFVLDGPLAPGLSQSEIAEAQTRGLQTELDDYIAACVKTLSQCPLGSSVDKASARLRQLLVAVDTKPLPTGDPARPLNQALAFFGIVETLYSPANWWLLSDALRSALAGNGQPLLNLADLYLGRNAQGYTSNATQANQAISCLDEQVAGGPTTIPESTFVADSPLIGDIMYGLADRGCGEWPPRTTLTPPDYSAPGAPPILVVGTTHDPVTPYFWAKQLTQILDNGVLLTRVGDGHTAYESGNKCIVNKVDAFFVDGTLPPAGTRC